LFRRLRRGLKNGIYSITVWLCLVLVKIFFGARIDGKQNLKRDGAYIVVARHRSYWDIPLTVVALGARNRIHFISRRGLMRWNPIFRPLIRAYTTIIDRERFSRDDFRRMLAACRRERLIGLFPEGTTKRRVDAKAGAVRFAAMTDKKFLPVNIQPRGPYPPKYPFRYPRVTVSIGAAFSVGDLEAEFPGEATRSDRYRMMSVRLMERVDTA